MLVRAPTSLLLLAFTFLCGLPTARAQCLGWRAFPLTQPQITGSMHALVVHDDGSGPALYAGGNFRLPASASPQAHYNVVRWDGTSFSTLPLTSSQQVVALLSFDDGSGPALYAAATLPPRVMKWNGSAWSTLGPQMAGTLKTLAVHDDGSGPALYLGGNFSVIGSVQANGIAKWTGTAWAALGTGPGDGNEAVIASTLLSFDDGTGAALYVGGTFLGLPGNASPHIAKWKSGAWTGVGAGMNGGIHRLLSWDDGSGPSLFATGNFSTPGLHVARWNGSAWSALGAGVPQGVTDAAILDDGTGEQLYVATWSQQPLPYGTVGLKRWNGATWSAFQPVAAPATCNAPVYQIKALASFDEGSGPRVFVGSSIGAFGPVLGILSRAQAGVWQRVGTPPRGVNEVVRALHVHDDGSGPALYAGGSFCQADDANATSVARWDGTGWHSVGGGRNWHVIDLVSYDPGTFPHLVAVGNDTFVGHNAAQLSRWDGASWVNMPSTQAPEERYYVARQFGQDLYVGGAFTSTDGGPFSPNLARWNPGTGFTAVGAGASAGLDASVRALVTFHDGSGEALYAGGEFTSAGGVPASRIARFDGASWTPLGSGMDALVGALVAFDDGSGPALYAGGAFTTAGGAAASRVAKWNGATWSALGAGLNAEVLTLEVLDDGSGPALYAGGLFTASGSTPVSRIARWNGTSWSASGGGADGTVLTLQAHDDGSGAGAQLFVGGEFHTVGGLMSDHVAAWRGCGTAAITKYCFGDGTDGACPCGNQGLQGRGCDNALATGGALLNATGNTSPDTIVLHAVGELPNAATLVFQGANALSQPLAFGDGFRCVGGSIQRLYTTNAINGTVTVPGVGQPSISARSATLGAPLAPGTVKSYQAWYRDPNLAFCAPPSGNAWNLSNAVRIVW